ncbi:MAG: ABC transporter permease [Bacteroidetes bacterium]|nr:ABC transporter permease [Bacteroidota bacterium]MDA0981121.1 ABC transporter permease [Bacteroidota bacterium]
MNIWRELISNKLALIGGTWIMLWVSIAIAGPILRPDPSENANNQHLDLSLLPPGTEVNVDGESFTFLLGSDRYGRDFLSRLMAGSVISLSVAGIAVAISLLIGLLLGAWAGYKGGVVDTVVSWFLQVVWSVPTLLMVLAITLAFGKGFWQVFVAIGLTMWVEVARIVRGQFISLRELEYVKAAKALGLSDFKIMFKHMLPNAMGPIIVVAAANFAAAILIEAGLSFLGVGARIPVPSWGNIVKEHYHLLTTDLAWLAVLPGALIASLVLAFTWLGDGFRQAFDVAK